MYPLETSLTGKTGAEDTASETLIRGIFPIVIYCGGYSAGAPPLPIPNREVKPGRADGTAPPGGRVGRCRFLQEEADCTGFRVFSLLSFYPAPSAFIQCPPLLILSSFSLSSPCPSRPPPSSSGHYPVPELSILYRICPIYPIYRIILILCPHPFYPAILTLASFPGYDWHDCIYPSLPSTLLVRLAQVHLSWFCRVSVPGVAPGWSTCHAFRGFLSQEWHRRVHFAWFCRIFVAGVAPEWPTYRIFVRFCGRCHAGVVHQTSPVNATELSRTRRQGKPGKRRCGAGLGECESVNVSL